ncbi:MAG: DUF1786 family protein [Chloroflexota bacterium]|nr:DUF1786 family protein [Chloroflexota bacterium]
MQALTIDVGTGTQDILLFDSEREIENAIRLVLPSPTVLVAGAIRRATRAGWKVVLTGSTMGGGPSAWAARDHAAARRPICATPEAARTFDDDLDRVQGMGVRIVAEEEATRLAEETLTLHLRLSDIWLDSLAIALAPFGIDLRAVDALGLAVFDHGAAPPGVSDRRFRFERLGERLDAEPGAGPAVFAYEEGHIPACFTRLTSGVAAARAWFGRRSHPSIVAMDTGPAAVLGALEDPRARRSLASGRAVVAVNVGNFHALAMRVSTRSGSPPAVGIDAIFEHHTGELDGPSLGSFVGQVADGTISNEEVFRSMGHGALVRHGWSPGGRRPLLALTGPRRRLLAGRCVPGLGQPHLAVPHGDMMQSGSFGLLRALAHRVPGWREPIEAALGRAPLS